MVAKLGNKIFGISSILLEFAFVISVKIEFAAQTGPSNGWHVAVIWSLKIHD